MRNNCIVSSQQDIEASSILDLGRMLVGEISAAYKDMWHRLPPLSARTLRVFET